MEPAPLHPLSTETATQAPDLATQAPAAPAQDRWLRRWAAPLLIAGVGATAVLYAPNGIDLGDEGFLAHGAQRMLHGELPHRDFYSLQGPLSWGLAAAWSALVGLSFLKLRLLGVVLHAAMVLLTHAIARRFANPRWAFAAAAVVVIAGVPHMHFAPLAVWQGITLSLIAIALAVRSVRMLHGRLAFASGMVAALSALTRHDQAAYMIVSLLVLAAALRLVPATRLSPGSRFRLGAWLIGATSIALPALLCFWGAGALPDMWEQLVLFPLTRYGATSALPMPTWAHDGPIAFLVFRATPMMAALAAGLIGLRIMRKGYGEGEAMGCFLVAWTLLFHAQVLVRSDLAHLVLTMAPAMVLLAWLPGYAIRSLGWEVPRQARLRHLVVAAGVLGFIAQGAVAWHMLLPMQEDGALPITSARAGLVDVDAPRINAVVAEIEERSERDEAVLVLPYHPAYYVLADRRNPTRWGYHWPGDRTQAEMDALIAQLHADRPAMAVIFRRDSTARFLGPVLSWIEAHYAPIDPAADPVIYTPREH